jgi:hypothetical protein
MSIYSVKKNHQCRKLTAETSGDEHADCLGGRLEDSSDDHDGGTEEDSLLASDTVGNIRGDGSSGKGSDVLDGVEETELVEKGGCLDIAIISTKHRKSTYSTTAGVVESALPLGKSLETVHHGPVITVG